MLLYWSWYLTPHPVDVVIRVHLLTAPLLLYRPVAMVHQAGAGGKTMHRYGPMLRGLLRLADEVAAMQPWCGTSGSEIQWIPPKSLDLGFLCKRGMTCCGTSHYPPDVIHRIMW